MTLEVVGKEHKKAKSHHHKKTADQIEHESGQLDNLFLTLRDGIVETIDHKKKPKKKKHHKKPKVSSLIQLDSVIIQS